MTILTEPSLNYSSINAIEIRVIQDHDLIKNDSYRGVVIPQTSEIWSSRNQSNRDQQLPTSSVQSSLSIVGDLTEGQLASKPSAKFSLDNQHYYYTFSPDRHELSTPENNSHTGELGEGDKIALVAPTFTAAAYKYYFYQFYSFYAKTPPGKNVTTNLDYLTAKVPGLNSTSSSFAMLKLVSDIGWLTPGSNVTVITDDDVNRGSIFTEPGSGRNIINSNVVNSYDVIILGHQEYVTQNEYDNLRKFVANGGTMIILDGNV